MRKKFLQTNMVRVVLAAGLLSADASAASKPSAPAPAARPAPAPARPASAPAKAPATGTAAGGRGTSTTTTTTGARAGGTTTTNTATKGITTTSATAPRPTTTTTTTTATHPGAAMPAGGRGSAPPAPAKPAINRPAPAGSNTKRAANGADIRTRANGQRSDLHDPKRGMDVHNGLGGNRMVRVDRPDGSRVVAERGGRGYVQRPYTFRGREFEHRTYFVNGRAYDRFYRPYAYRGVALEIYAPARYYPVGYYGWAYHPWVAPAPYAWGFAGNPWYGYYGVYFVPQPVYPSASYWLTDYMISSSLQDSYQAGVEAGRQMQPLPAGPTPLTPDVKAQISQEVQRQIALENQEAQSTSQGQDVDPQSSGVARMLTDADNHVFVVGHDLDVVDSTGKECLVTPGDVLQLRKPQPATGDTAGLQVLASKGGQECGRASTVLVALNDLQDMQNSMRERIDQGLGELQAKQGHGGLPAEPATAGGAPVAAPFTQGAPPPEPNIATEIAQQAQEADRAEAEANQSAQMASGPGPYISPATPAKEVSLGMTQQQVTDLLGPPKSIANQGTTRKMFVYSDMKVIFNLGKVVDIQ